MSKTTGLIAYEVDDHAQKDLIASSARLSLTDGPQNNAMNDDIKNYARSSCLRLSARLLALPREIRDMIYKHLLKDMSVFFHVIWPPDDSIWNGGCAGPPCTCLDSLPHIVNINYMGEQVTKEVLTAFKSKAEDYQVNYSIHARELPSFFEADVFHVGITREQLFRGLNLDITMGHFLYSDDDVWRVVESNVLQNIDTTTRLLLGISYEGARSITFQFSHSSVAVNLARILCKLHHAFYGLKEKGFRVSLEYEALELDIDWILGNDTWQWSVAEWKKNMRRMSGEDLLHVANLPPYLFEEEYQKQEPIWNTIAQELYGVRLEEGL